MVAMKESIRSQVTSAPLTKPTTSDEHQDDRGGLGPGQALLHLQSDRQNLRHAEVIADRQIELLGGEREHFGQRQQGGDRLAHQDRVEARLLNFLLRSPKRGSCGCRRSKARRVIDLVRGKSVADALDILRWAPQAASEPVAKVIASAAANAQNNNGLDPATLVVATVYADDGPTAKRRMWPQMECQAAPFPRATAIPKPGRSTVHAPYSRSSRPRRTTYPAC